MQPLLDQTDEILLPLQVAQAVDTVQGTARAPGYDSKGNIVPFGGGDAPGVVGAIGLRPNQAFDVSAYTGLLIFVQGVGTGGSPVVVVPQWFTGPDMYAQPGTSNPPGLGLYQGAIVPMNTLAADPLNLWSANPIRTIEIQSDAANSIEMYAMRNLGPYLQVAVFNDGNAPLGATKLGLALTNRPLRFDGPYTPGVEGAVLFYKSQAFVPGNTTFTIYGYGGPALLTMRGGALNLHGGAWLRHVTTSGAVQEVAQVGIGANLADRVACWIPPGRTDVNVANFFTSNETYVVSVIAT